MRNAPLGEQFFGSPKAFACELEWLRKKKRSKQKIRGKNEVKQEEDPWKVPVQKANLDHSWTCLLAHIKTTHFLVKGLLLCILNFFGE